MDNLVRRQKNGKGFANSFVDSSGAKTSADDQNYWFFIIKSAELKAFETISGQELLTDR